MRINSAQNGFTLVEVLVALAVATIGITAVTLTTITAGMNANTLRERTLAHWVAMNVAAELRLADTQPDVGTSDGDSEFAGLDWRWEIEVSETDVEALRRAEIAVSYADTPDDEITRLIVFVGKPVPGLQFREWTGPKNIKNNLQARP